MNLQFSLDRYTYYSGKAGDIVRQLGFAGIAIIWIFKSDTDKQWKVPQELIPAAILITISLGLDFLQYVAGALAWERITGSRSARVPLLRRTSWLPAGSTGRHWLFSGSRSFSWLLRT